MAFVGVILRGAVRAGHMAVAAANAYLFVDHHKTVFALMHRAARTDLGAGRIFAVVTGDGEVIGKHVLLPDAVVLLPVAAGILIDPAEADLRSQVLVVLTGQLAGFASGTASGVDKESILRAHGLLLKPSRYRPGWYAVDSPSPAATGGGWSGYSCRRHGRSDLRSYWRRARRPSPSPRPPA